MSTQMTVVSATQQLMAKSFTDRMVGLPLGGDIFLLETHVAGLQYYQASEIVGRLQAGNTLILRREPANPHDDLAIEILVASGQKLGYVPRFRNPVLARLMDAGKELLATVAIIDANSGIEFSAMAGRVQEADDGPGREKSKAAGMTINVIPAAELQKWKKAADALDDEWMANMTKAGHDGPKLFKTAQDLIKKYTK